MDHSCSSDKKERIRKAGGPDGMEAWCVALSACFITFVIGGFGRMAGILYVALIDTLHVNRFEASLPFSTRTLTRHLLGPAVGIIGQKYGVRATTLIGGIIGTISTALCFCSQNIAWITIFYGFLGGAGASLTVTIPQVVLNHHFEKHLATANGLAFSGSCIGSCLFPTFVEYLLKTYGIGGSFLIMSGIIMNIIPAAVLLRKPSWMKKVTKKITDIPLNENFKMCQYNDKNFENKSENPEMKYAKNGEEKFIEYKDDQHQKTKECGVLNIYENPNLLPVDTKFLRENNDLFIKLLKNINLSPEDDYNTFSRLPKNVLRKYLEDLYIITDRTVKDICSPNKIAVSSTFCPMHSKSKYNQTNSENVTKETILSVHTLKYNAEFYIFLSNQISKFLSEVDKISSQFTEEDFRKLLKIIEQINLIINELATDKNHFYIINNHKDNEIPDEKSIDEHANTFKVHMKTLIKLQKNPIFLLICFSRSVSFMSFVPVMIIIVDFLTDKGLLKEDGKYAIAAISFGDFMGCLCLGWITDKEYLSLPRYMFIVMVLQGGSIAAISFMISKPALLLSITIFGAIQGSLFIRHHVLISKYMRSHEQSVAMGCLNFFSGLLAFALPSYIGYFRDTVGSYDGLFYINGAISTIVGIMWYFEPHLVKWTSLS